MAAQSGYTLRVCPRHHRTASDKIRILRGTRRWIVPSCVRVEMPVSLWDGWGAEAGVFRMSDVAVEGPERPSAPWSWLILSGKIGECWEASRGFTTGFNYIRIALATAVVFAHCHALTFGGADRVFARTVAGAHGGSVIQSVP